MTDETSGLSKADAKKLIDEKLKEAYAAISEAESIADEHKLSFCFDVAYGMGGTYIGDREERGGYEDYGLDEENGWRPSSIGC